MKIHAHKLMMVSEDFDAALFKGICNITIAQVYCCQPVTVNLCEGSHIGGVSY